MPGRIMPVKRTAAATTTKSKPVAKVKPPVIKTVSDLIKYIEKNCVADTVLFRGQNKDWPLMPKIGRSKSRIDDRLAFESLMLKDFKRLSKPYLHRMPETEWDWLALAQHHGLPTRLLDWTTNPLTALWFAVCHPPIDKADGVIWLYNVSDTEILSVENMKELVPYNSSFTKVFQPEILTSRIQVQNGWFTVHKYSTSTGRFTTLEKVKRISSKEMLQKLSIPFDRFHILRDELERLGINRLSLFQDLDGVASHIEWLHTLLDDESSSKKKGKLTSE